MAGVVPASTDAHDDVPDPASKSVAVGAGEFERRRRHALIVACDTYDDEHFSELRAPIHDVAALTRVLSDPMIGNFTVRSLLNQPVHQISNSLADFLQDRQRDDLAVMYFSCHGIKDDNGRLYLAGRDTRFDRLRTSAIRASVLHEEMDDSRAQQIVLLLDCCFSGAWSREMAPRASERLDVAEQLGGRGRTVITASSATEYAFEDGQRVDNKPMPSFFTEAVVEGLETGAADRDGDGQISAEELYFYVYDRVQQRTSKQTPTRSIQAGQGDVYLARRPRPLPPELQAAEDGEDRWTVLGLIEELAPTQGARCYRLGHCRTPGPRAVDPASRSAGR